MYNSRWESGMMRARICWLALIGVIGCMGPEAGVPGGGSPAAERSAVAAALTGSQAGCILDVVNNCALTHEYFDVTLEWDQRAASALVAKRSGPDGACGTADDIPIATIQALDELPYVGDAAISSLLSHVVGAGCQEQATALVVEGVPYSPDQARLALRVANKATLQQLDEDAGLRSDTAANIVAGRPYEMDAPDVGLIKLSAVPRVGSDALWRLRTYATSGVSAETPCDTVAGSVEGVPFDPRQAHDALDLANHGGAEDLRRITGIGGVLSERILAARAPAPFRDLAAVGLISGVGPAVLQALRDEVASTWCHAPAARCGCAAPEAPPVKPPSGPADLSGALGVAEALLANTSAPMTRRFVLLLGLDGYQRLTDVVLDELEAIFSSAVPSSVGAIESALATLLDQSRFARPFDTVSASPPIPGDLEAARNLAADGLIRMLSVQDLESTDVGVSFESLIAGGGESAYLADIQRWRGGASLDPEVVPLSTSWLLRGTFLGLLVEVTVSRSTGELLGQPEVQTDYPF